MNQQKNKKWPLATWLYLTAIHHVDFSQSDAAKMGSEGDEAVVYKDRVNAIILLILLNLSLSFLSTEDYYNSERCASLGLFYADRRSKAKELKTDPVRAKLLFRRGSARYAMNKKEANKEGQPQNPNRFASALTDLQEALVLERDLGGDGATAKLLSEVTKSHDLAKKSQPTDTAAIPEVTMEDEMLSDNWMADCQQPPSPMPGTHSESNENVPSKWDPIQQLLERFHIARKQADWSKVPQKICFLLILECALIYFKVPGYESINIFSAIVPIIIILVRPMMIDPPEDNYEPGVLYSPRGMDMAERTLAAVNSTVTGDAVEKVKQKNQKSKKAKKVD